MKISSRPEDLFGAFGLLFVAALVKRGVDRVEVFAIKLFLSDAESVSKALIVHDLTLAQVAQRITHVGVIAKANEVVVGRARLLFCCQVLVEVGDDVALDADVFHIKGHAGCRYGIDARGVVNKVGRKGGVGNLFLRDVARQLIEDCCHHFKVRELFCAY